MVLLKNSGILPLHSNVGIVHLCGPFVEDVNALLGTWVFGPTDNAGADVPVSPAAALADRLEIGNLLVSDGRFGDLTLRHADHADLTVAIVGEHPSRSGEDRCLPTADLPVGQLELLRELATLGKPLVVVVVTGRPLELRPVLQLADAVLIAWHPGTESGPALADVLLGTQAPAGRTADEPAPDAAPGRDRHDRPDLQEPVSAGPGTPSSAATSMRWATPSCHWASG